MPLLRLNEHYTSVQGEGPHVGELTQFVRFSGCNMRCPGWPCDTQHAIQPNLYRNDPKFGSDDLIAKILDERYSTGARRICLTGGEPFMQDNNMLKYVVMGLMSQGIHFDIFTNGSFLFPEWATNTNITIVMDWKLPGSGEASTAVEVRTANVARLYRKDAIKFVVKDEQDLVAAFEIGASAFSDLPRHPDVPIYIGRTWDSELKDSDIIHWLMVNQLDWRLNVQLHKWIFPGIDRGI